MKLVPANADPFKNSRREVAEDGRAVCFVCGMVYFLEPGDCRIVARLKLSTLFKTPLDSERCWYFLPNRPAGRCGRSSKPELEEIHKCCGGFAFDMERVLTKRIGQRGRKLPGNMV